MDVTSIHSINTTNYISMKDDEKYMHKYYAPFLLSNIHEDFSSRSEYGSEKLRVCRSKNITLDLLLNKSTIFE